MKTTKSRTILPQRRGPAFGNLVILVVAVSAATNCAPVKFIGDYDDTFDQEITDVQQKAELYFARLQSNPSTPFDQSFHDGISSRLAVLKTRATSLPKYEIIASQITELKSQFDNFQKVDKSMARPFPVDTLATIRTGIQVSLESILKLEFALKRGSTPIAPSPKASKSSS